MKWKTIVSTSEKIKKQIEKNKTLPTITGYNNGELLYILAKAVQTPNKDITDKKVENAPDPSGNNINNNLTRNEYQKLAKSTVKWIDDKGTAPNYTMYQKYNVSVKLQLYCYSKIIVFYHEHSNTLPLTCWFKYTDVSNTKSTNTNNKKSSNTSTSKYGHATKSGCDNMGQNNGYYCACHSLQEVIRNLYGIIVPQSTIAKWAGTTTSGTSHNGIRTAVAMFNKTYNKNLKIEEKSFSEVGWSGLDKICKSNNQDSIHHLLYRRNGNFGYGHYEVINNVSSNINVQNSLGSYCSQGCYCGYIEYRTQSTHRYYLEGISQKSILILTRG